MGFLKYPSLPGSISTGCINSPTFKSRFCETHSPRSCVSMKPLASDFQPTILSIIMWQSNNMCHFEWLFYLIIAQLLALLLTVSCVHRDISSSLSCKCFGLGTSFGVVLLMSMNRVTKWEWKITVVMEQIVTVQFLLVLLSQSLDKYKIHSLMYIILSKPKVCEVLIKHVWKVNIQYLHVFGPLNLMASKNINGQVWFIKIRGQ